MVVHAFRRQRIMPVALDFVAQRPDHLRVTEITSFAYVDRAPCQLERRIGPHAIDLLDRALEIEERCDLDDAADGDYEQNADDQKDRILFENLVPSPERHDALSSTR